MTDNNKPAFPNDIVVAYNTTLSKLEWFMLRAPYPVPEWFDKEGCKEGYMQWPRYFAEEMLRRSND